MKPLYWLLRFGQIISRFYARKLRYSYCIITFKSSTGSTQLLKLPELGRLSPLSPSYTVYLSARKVAVQCGAGSGRARIGNKLRWAVWPSGPVVFRCWWRGWDATLCVRRHASGKWRKLRAERTRGGRRSRPTYGRRTIIASVNYCVVAVSTQHSMSSSLTALISLVMTKRFGDVCTARNECIVMYGPLQ